MLGPLDTVVIRTVMDRLRVTNEAALGMINCQGSHNFLFVKLR